MHPWDLCEGGSTAYWETANGNMPSGTVDVLAMLNWLVHHGQLPAGVQLGGFSYGFEISSTGGVDKDFQVSSFTAAAVIMRLIPRPAPALIRPPRPVVRRRHRRDAETAGPGLPL